MRLFVIFFITAFAVCGLQLQRGFWVKKSQTQASVAVAPTGEFKPGTPCPKKKNMDCSIPSDDCHYENVANASGHCPSGCGALICTEQPPNPGR